ncbi:MAG: FixH family protein [Geovibrio sp.]|nr:FixH family protein [Geovibrio sp.]
MKRLILTAALMLILAVSAFAAPLEITKQTGDFTVVSSLDRNPPVKGKNTVSIVIKDKDGKAVQDAKAAVYYSMPAMPGMPAMDYKTMAEFKNGAYSAVLDLSMTGPWNVEVRFVAPPSKTMNRVSFSVDVR